MKTAAVVLMLGRQCSRGRLGVVVHAGIVDVPGDNAPSAPPPLDTHSSCLHGTVAPVLATPTAIHRQPPVSPTWCGGGAPSPYPPPFPPSSPRLPSRLWNRVKGENPSGWWEANRGSIPGCRRWVKAARGKRFGGAPWLAGKARTPLWHRGYGW
jgi:hypothetical protein